LIKVEEEKTKLEADLELYQELKIELTNLESKHSFLRKNFVAVEAENERLKESNEVSVTKIFYSSPKFGQKQPEQCPCEPSLKRKAQPN
jgi:hypothetical protein